MQVEDLEVDGLGPGVAVDARSGRSPRTAFLRSARAGRSRRRDRSPRPAARPRRRRSRTRTVLAMLVGSVAGSRPIASHAACTRADDRGEAVRRRERHVELARVLRGEARGALGAEPADHDRRPRALHRLRQRGGVVERVVLTRRTRTARPSGVVQSPVMTASCSSNWSKRSPVSGNGMPYAACSRSFQPAPRPSSTRPPLIASTCATAMASGPGSRNVTGETSVPSRRRGRVAREAGEGDPRVGRAGEAVAEGEADVVVGAEVGVEAELLGEARHRELVVVAGAFLGLGEDPEAHVRVLAIRAHRRRYARDPMSEGTGLTRTWEKAVDVTNQVGDRLLQAREPRHRPPVGDPGPAVLRSGRLPVGPRRSKPNWKSIRVELDAPARAPRRAAELPGHHHRPVQPHRRRPLEDLLLLRLRLPQRRQLRPLPRDHAPRRAHPRDGDRDVLDPRTGQAHPAARRSVQGRAALPPRPRRARRAGRASGHQGGRPGARRGPRAAASCSTTRSSTRRGTTPTRPASCSSSTSCARCGSRCGRSTPS